MPRQLAVTIFLMAMISAPTPSPASRSTADTMAICRNAAISAADRHSIPRKVLVAITLVETRTRRGGQSGPWPWTVNVAGTGTWFDSRAAALLHAQRALAGGQPSFDVGCFQLNYRWHGENFTSIDQMFEPAPSGDYAARFLRSLYAETGDWIEASGLYHSRTQKHAERYRGLVAKAVRSMGGRVPEEIEIASAPPETEQSKGLLRTTRGQALILLNRGNAASIPRGATSGSLGLGSLPRGRGPLISPQAAIGGG